jgi:hypothetical protein
MLRSIDIQSRVAVGFATGGPVVEGRYSFTTEQAHAWVEVFFPGWGWMPFEPTPGRVNAMTYVASTPDPCPGPDCIDDPSGGGGPSASGIRNVLDTVFEKEIGSQGPGGSRVGTPGTIYIPQDDPPLVSRTSLLIAVIIVGLVLLLLIPPARALGRRVRLRRAAAEPRRMILVTYEVFTERAAGLGLGRASGETLDEYRRKVMDRGYLSDGHLDRLTRLATAAAYSDHEPGQGQAQEAGDAADTAIREMRRAVGPATWFVGLYRARGG